MPFVQNTNANAYLLNIAKTYTMEHRNIREMHITVQYGPKYEGHSKNT